MILYYPGGPNVITGALKEEGWRVRNTEDVLMGSEARESERDEDATLLVAEDGEVTTSQRMQAASGSWKCQAIIEWYLRLSPDLPEGMQLLQHVNFSPVRCILEFQNSRTLKKINLCCSKLLSL